MQIDIVDKERRSERDLSKTEADIYKTRSDILTSWYNMLNENQKAQLQKAGLEVQKAIELLKARLESLVSINKLRGDILNNIGNVASSTMSAAMNAVSTHIGHTTNWSASLSESLGYTGHLAEEHSFQHDAA